MAIVFKGKAFNNNNKLEHQKNVWTRLLPKPKIILNIKVILVACALAIFNKSFRL